MNMSSSTLKIGVIGYGYWGPNVVRNFYNVPNATVTAVCDANPKSLARVRSVYPSMTVTTNSDHILTAGSRLSILAISLAFSPGCGDRISLVANSVVTKTDAPKPRIVPDLLS